MSLDLVSSQFEIEEAGLKRREEGRKSACSLSASWIRAPVGDWCSPVLRSTRQTSSSAERRRGKGNKARRRRKESFDVSVCILGRNLHPTLTPEFDRASFPSRALDS